MTADDREAAGWTPEKNEAMKAAMLNNLTDVLQTFEACMVTKFVVLCETVDAEGQKGLWTCESEGIAPWETLGLLAWAQQVAQGRAVWRETPAADDV